MAQIIIAPGKYVQGKGELAHLADYVAPLGKKPFVLVSPSGMKRVKEPIEAGFGSTPLVFEAFNGECSKNEVDRLIGLMGDCDVMIGVGGGKILDTAKAVGYYTGKPVAIVPTIASTDAPCSALSVLYTDDGVFDQYLFLPSNPNLVLLDTDIIAAAPARLLVSGMGDALATFFEARAVSRSNSGTCAGGKVTKAALALAELCYNTLISDGLKAKLAVENHVCTKAVEDVIEANTYLSGIGFESGGLAAAHAIHNGLTVLEESHGMYHGEKVAFGTLCQLVLENAPVEELAEVADFCLTVGLPVTLADIGIVNPSKQDLMAVAEATCAEGESIYNMPMEITPEKVYAAIVGADAMGRFYKGE
ncbi:MAG: glycerol dehydrogenase [Oscillospiraceae bacterium]|jgi:glycerol dehydrogenase